MLHLSPRWALKALLLLSFTAFVQTATIEIPYNDQRVVYTPASGWSLWTYSETVPCPGTYNSGAEDGKHTISLSFTGTGITVYGYSDAVAPWLFQLDNAAPEALSVLPNSPCRIIKDVQRLKEGDHQVVVTPQKSNFILTKFIVTTGNAPSGNGTATGTVIPGTVTTGTDTTGLSIPSAVSNATHHLFSGAFSLDGGKQVIRLLLLVLPAYFFFVLSGL